MFRWQDFRFVELAGQISMARTLQRARTASTSTTPESKKKSRSGKSGWKAWREKKEQEPSDPAKASGAGAVRAIADRESETEVDDFEPAPISLPYPENVIEEEAAAKFRPMMTSPASDEVPTSPEPVEPQAQELPGSLCSHDAAELPPEASEPKPARKRLRLM